MKISPAKAHQIANIFKVLQDAKKALEQELIFQWYDEYPNIDIVAADVHSKSLYTCRVKNTCAGIITISEEQDPEYATVDWKDRNGKVLVVHRLVVHPTHQKQGIARRLMDFAEGYAIQNSYTSIRLDAYSGNERAVRFYLKRGYRICGEVKFKKRELPFYCFEKILMVNSGTS